MSDYHDYNENLAFEPKMTWEELVEKYGDGDDDVVSIKTNSYTTVSFWKDGDISVSLLERGVSARICIAENKAPEQMKTIIQALWG